MEEALTEETVGAVVSVDGVTGGGVVTVEPDTA
jgi:hypothetical protein